MKAKLTVAVEKNQVMAGIAVKGKPGALATQEVSQSVVTDDLQTKLIIRNVIYDPETGDEITFENIFPLTANALENIEYCRHYSLSSLFATLTE